MNNFAALDAQSEMSAFAFVQSNEVAAEWQDAAPVAPAPRGLNTSKLVRHNLRQPLASRIERAALSARVAFARERGNIIALWSAIHAECEPQRQAIRARFDAAENL